MDQDLKPENVAAVGLQAAKEVVADGLLKVPEAARFFNVSVAKLYKLMHDGVLPFCKIGRARRIPRRALVELAARHLIGGAGDVP